jgi:hypothetical protein
MRTMPFCKVAHREAGNRKLPLFGYVYEASVNVVSRSTAFQCARNSKTN